MRQVWRFACAAVVAAALRTSARPCGGMPSCPPYGTALSSRLMRSLRPRGRHVPGIFLGGGSRLPRCEQRLDSREARLHLGRQLAADRDDAPDYVQRFLLLGHVVGQEHWNRVDGALLGNAQTQILLPHHLLELGERHPPILRALAADLRQHGEPALLRPPLRPPAPDIEESANGSLPKAAMLDAGFDMGTRLCHGG